MAQGEDTPGAGGVLVPPLRGRPGVGATDTGDAARLAGVDCPRCGAAMVKDPDGDPVCPRCGYVMDETAQERFVIDFDIKSVTESPTKTGTLVLEGYANTWEEDRDGETVAKDAFDHTITDFLTNPILLLNHKKEQVLGGIVHLHTDDTGLWVRAEVDKPPEKAEGWAHKAYADIKNRRLKTFSMGGLFHRSKGVGDKIHRVDLYEISVVAVPSNKTSLFRVAAEKGFSFEDNDNAIWLTADGIKAVDSADQRRRWAQQGVAMSNGSYPITKCGTGAFSVSAAVRAIGRGSSSHAAIQAHIVKRARALGCTDDLPDDWKSATNTSQGVKNMTTDADGDKGKGAAPDVITIDKKDWDATQATLRMLADEKAARDRDAEIERQAKAQLDAEAKAAAEEAAAKEAREAEIKAAVDERLKSLRAAGAGVGGGRKMVFGGDAGAGHPGGQAQSTRISDFMKALVAAKQGNPRAYEWLVEQDTKAAEAYGLPSSGGTKAYTEGAFTPGTYSATGGFLVPPQYLQGSLAEFRIAQAKVRQLCTVLPGINSNSVLIPRETGVSAVGWVAENAAKPSTDATFGQISVGIYVLAGIAKVSKQLLNDSTPAVDVIVRRGLGKALGQAEDIAFINGNGAGQPTGILNTAGVLTGAVGAKLWSSIAGAITTVASNYFANPTAILAHPRDVNTLRTTTDTAGRPIFLPNYWAGGNPSNGGPQAYLGGGAANPLEQTYNASPPDGFVFGLPIYGDANMPTNLGGGANETRMIIAAWDEAWIFEREGMGMDVSGEAGTSFEQNQFWFRIEERVGFTAARQVNAFYVMTGLTVGAGL